MTGLSVTDAEWFHKPEVKAVFACLNRDGFETRVVGGAVRNALLGQTVEDVDFATTARPADTLRLATEAGIRTIATGIDHGTVTLLVQGTPFEVTTLRRDAKTDGRHATVVFGKDWTEDARRRDFTMNALYADRSGAVYDPLGGASDLMARRVRFVGDARTRIKEDYLRILRFFRFSARYASGPFDSDGVSAAIRERLGLDSLSRERVRAEMMQILVARRAADAIEIMDEAGLLQPILGGVAQRKRFERLAALETELGLPPTPILRLATLGVFVAEDATRLAQRLRLSSKEAKDLLNLATPVFKDCSLSKPELDVILYRMGPHLSLVHLLLEAASNGLSACDPKLVCAAERAASWVRPKFPITGADLISRGWTAGAALGDTLKRLEEEWLASGFVLDREALLERADAPSGDSVSRR